MNVQARAHERTIERQSCPYHRGSTGIGLATAQAFVEEGAYVYITGRRQKELDEAVKLIGGNVKGIQGDVTSFSDLDRLYDTIKKEKGSLDVLFANAGIGAVCPLDKVTEDHFNKTFDVNVKGLLFTVQKALPILKDGASIILTSSIASCKAFDNFSVYCATKAAVRSFARCWTLELEKRKIRVNALSPGMVLTPFFNDMGLSQADVQKFIQDLQSKIPLQRPGKEEEIAKSAVFLASDASSYITGIELTVDGGYAEI